MLLEESDKKEKEKSQSKPQKTEIDSIGGWMWWMKDRIMTRNPENQEQTNLCDGLPLAAFPPFPPEDIVDLSLGDWKSGSRVRCG